MQTLAGQRRVIITSAMVTLTVGILAGYERGETLPTARFLIGTGMAFTICSIMVDLGSPMGAGFAGLILIASLLYNGEEALAILNRRSKPDKRTRKRIRKFRRIGQLEPVENPDTIDTVSSSAVKQWADQFLANLNANRHR